MNEQKKLFNLSTWLTANLVGMFSFSPSHSSIPSFTSCQASCPAISDTKKNDKRKKSYERQQSTIKIIIISRNFFHYKTISDVLARIGEKWSGIIFNCPTKFPSKHTQHSFLFCAVSSFTRNFLLGFHAISVEMTGDAIYKLLLNWSMRVNKRIPVNFDAPARSAFVVFQDMRYN